jgi:carboxymethylenebutenolidase
VPDVDVAVVDGGSSRLRGYLAVPDGDGPWPGVVAIHESFGVNDIVRRQADRLAAAGYLTLAPDLYTDGGGVRCLIPTFRALFTGKGKAIADIEAARRFLHEHESGTGRVGVIGFCMGGGFALVTARRGFDAASVNYGQLPRHAEQALSGACPIVASYGGRDLATRGMPRKLDRTLSALGIEHDVKIYPTAGHSFLNDEDLGPPPLPALQRIVNVGPNPEAAADAWQRIEAFFARHLRD